MSVTYAETAVLASHASNTLTEFKSTVLAGYHWLANTYRHDVNEFTVSKPDLVEDERLQVPQTSVVDYRRLDV